MTAGGLVLGTGGNPRTLTTDESCLFPRDSGRTLCVLEDMCRLVKQVLIT